MSNSKKSPTTTPQRGLTTIPCARIHRPVSATVAPSQGIREFAQVMRAAVKGKQVASGNAKVEARNAFEQLFAGVENV